MQASPWFDSQPVQVALRTYALSLSLSLGPSLVPFITSLLSANPSHKTGLQALRRVLRRELGFDGFAFAMTLSVGGGAAIRRLWRALDDTPRKHPDSLQEVARLNLSLAQKTFISYILSSSIGILLLQAGRRRSYRLRRDLTSPNVIIPLTPPTPVISSSQASPRTSDTLDLTLLLLVRAVDAFLQNLILKTTGQPATKEHRSDHPSTEDGLAEESSMKEKSKQDAANTLTSHIDAFVFWACSARIMWCFFYEPQRLPRSYVKWIATLANLDGRVVQTLRLIREGRWSYLKGSDLHSNLLTGLSTQLGHNASWGDPVALPAYGGAAADAAWKILGVNNRSGVGGLPCELVHGTVGSSLGLEGSCIANSSIRSAMAFLEAIAIYLPAHFLPVLLTRPQTLLNPRRALTALFGAIQSATFLSAFVTLYWSAVCITRSLVFARLFPGVSHDFWDGPFGCIFAGSLVCGSSIWIENGRRRGEMALYVLPRAVRACLPDAWVRNSSKKARIAERIAFILSFSTLITAAIHRPETLRGLSRWTLSFITNGPNAGFWKRKRRDPGAPGTPNTPPTPRTGNEAGLPHDSTLDPLHGIS
ncbi:hypothetical protein D9615_010073 [Tricholomella constricta]|uniref:Integral membrane protein n=1 Tax=Tricholomella constricta TaxID=117010 RepID=A0A8H5LUP1_9AGAR|nr:hypothetical protein D9615_010073 [Tricholomella constricta]